MTMITKTRGPSTSGPYDTAAYLDADWKPTPYTWWSPSNGESTITYLKGPQWSGGRCNWKPCVHTSSGTWSVNLPYVIFGQSRRNPRGILLPQVGNRTITPPNIDRAAISECFSSILGQLDLNCHDSVLIYSGILQAIPLLGGCLKFVSIMNQLGRRLKRGMRKQPFTTVIKSAISLDFIDRFVVKPTIDDARKFLQAHNYVLNRINMAAERSAPLPTAYQAEASSKHVESSQAFEVVNYLASDSVRFGGTLRKQTRQHTKISLLANVSYNTSAIDPIRLWAARCGVTKPLESVWDLIPFSFVVDYFTRAGDFISGISERYADQDALRGKIQSYTGCWSCCKATHEWEWKFDSFRTSYSSWRFVTLESRATGLITYGAEVFSRQPFNPLSVEGTMSSDMIHLDLSTTQKRTLLELFVQGKLRR